MWQRCRLLRELLQEAVDARQQQREEEEAGGKSPKVRPPPTSHVCACLLAARLRCFHLPYLTAATCRSLPLPLAQAALSRIGQAAGGTGGVAALSMSMRDKRHVRVLTPSERLASTRFQVGAGGGWGGARGARLTVLCTWAARSICSTSVPWLLSFFLALALALASPYAPCSCAVPPRAAPPSCSTCTTVTRMGCAGTWAPVAAASPGSTP